MPVLVTGATGFLGSEIVRRARESGLVVRATDRVEAPPDFPGEYHRADILDPEGLLPAMSGTEGVIHAAGLAHVFGQAKAAVAPFKAVNATGTLNVARMASKAGVKHFVLVSSVAVYGSSGGQDHIDSACRPEGPYAESKWQAEQRAIEVARETGMQLTILRLATLYGEGDPGNIARLMRLIDRGRFVWVGNGSNRKSLIHREDAARACIAAACAPDSGTRIFNVSAPACLVRGLVEGLASLLGRRIPRLRIPAPFAMRLIGTASRLANGRGPFGTAEAALRKWLADDVYDGGLFEEAFEFRARIGLTEGLRREVAWHRHRQ